MTFIICFDNMYNNYSSSTEFWRERYLLKSPGIKKWKKISLHQTVDLYNLYNHRRVMDEWMMKPWLYNLYQFCVTECVDLPFVH